MTNIADILRIKFPNLRWHLGDVNDFSTITWLSDGPYPTEEEILSYAEEVAVLAPRVDMSVSARQFRLALLQFGLLDTCESAVRASNNRAVEISWDYATSIERLSPLIVSFAAMLDIQDDLADEIFRVAETL